MVTKKYIPSTMKKMNNWIFWRKELRDGRTTKIPINAKTFGNAMSNNPDTWCTYEYVYKNFDKSKVNGAGFMLPLDKSITMIDLDHCIENGKINQFALNIMNCFKDTYIEISQSGTGIHIFVLGGVEKSVKTTEIEIYSEKRFCALTGNALQAMDLAEHQKELNILFEQYGKKIIETPIIKSTGDLDVREIMQIIRKSRNADKFNQYFNGEVPANSENTLGLASILAFYCGNDEGKIKQIIEMSGMYREKCNRATNGRTWLDLVIETAIKSSTEVYEPRLNNYYQKQEDKTRELIMKIENQEYSAKFIRLSDVIDKDESNTFFVKSNFLPLDKSIIGFAEDEVSVWSGLNGSGKSNFLNQQILEYASQGLKTMLFSGEMPDYSIRNILMKMVAGKENLKQNKDGVSWYIPDDKKKAYILNWLDRYVYLYRNDSSMDAKEVINAIKYIVTQGVKVIILDNLMTLNLASYNNKDKYEAQSMFAKDLAKLAKSLHIHIHIVMHPRKAGGFLRKEDISGSADLSNAVDNVLIIHRVNNDFKKRSTEILGANANSLFAYDNVIEICKNRRNGAQDVYIGLYFEKETKKFVSSERENKQYLRWI